MKLDFIQQNIDKLSTFRVGREDNSLLESATVQLNYLAKYLGGLNVDKNRLEEINIGLIAVREIEGVNDELAEELYQIDYWVKKDLLHSI